MKNCKKIISILVAVLSLFTLMFAFSCNKPEDNEPENPNQRPVGNVILNDFENYKPDFSLIRLVGQFGAINVNKDAKYVKSGKSSAKLQPLGGYKSTTSPLMYVPLSSKLYNYDYRDLTYIKQFTADVYNAEDYDVNMTYGLAMEAVNTDMISKSNAKKISLKPGWNSITYEIDPSIINILYDITNAQGVYFGFDSIGTRNIEDAPVVYLDNINLLFSSQPAVIENFLVFDENEICNFDKLYQRYVAYCEAENPAAEPDISVVKTSDYGVKATSGQYALKLVTRPGNRGGTYERLIFPEALMAASALPKVKPEDMSNSYFCFDIYALNKSMIFYPEYFDTGYGVCYNKWACDSGIKKWTTIRIKLSELKQSMVERPGFFRLAWGEYNPDDGELSFLLDSFRIEKI